MSDPIRDLKRELLSAAERQHRSTPVATGLWGRLRAPRRLVLVTASLSIAAALALVVSAPWTDSPGFLEEARAALTAPPDTIRHVKWEVTSTSTNAACTVTRGPTEFWSDTTPPYRWRVLRRDLPLVEEDVPPDVTEPECWKGVTSELGGTINPVCTASGCEPILTFVAPNILRVSPVGPGFLPDPVNGLREAIDGGQAHDEGTTQLGGRTVERIRIDPPDNCGELPIDLCPRQPTYAYVDPETFDPVEIHNPEFLGVRSVARFLTFEYLPRTPANLALTDIRAQHPGATVSGPLS
jgi:hypothetical protein